MARILNEKRRDIESQQTSFNTTDFFTSSQSLLQMHCLLISIDNLITTLNSTRNVSSHTQSKAVKEVGIDHDTASIP